MAKDSSTIWFFDYTTSPYSRVQTTLNQGFTLTPESPPFCTGGKSPLGDGDLFYFEHVASAAPFDTHNKLLSAGTTGGSYTESNSDCTEQDQVIKRFITDSGVPNFAGNLSGTWTFKLECKETTLGAGCPDSAKRIFVKIYKHMLGDSAGVDALLGESSHASVNTSLGIRTVTWSSSGSMIATDRLVIRVYASWEDIGVLT